MKRAIMLLRVSVIFTASVIAVLIGCSDDCQAQSTTAVSRPVTIVRLDARDFSRETNLTGSVSLYREEQVGFEVSGRVLAVLDVGKEVLGPAYDEQGRLVRAGGVIARLDDTRYKLGFEALRARLNSLQKQLEAQRIDLERVAEANLQGARARLQAAVNDVEVSEQEIEAAQAASTLAQQTLERQQRLLASGAGNQQAVDNAQGNYDSALAREAQARAALQAKRSFLDAQRALVVSAEAAIVLKGAEVESTEAKLVELEQELKRAQEDVDDTILLAPFSGRITEIHVAQGAVIQPMTNGMIFGLIFSTALTLIVVPVLYVTFVEKLRMKVGKIVATEA